MSKMLVIKVVKVFSLSLVCVLLVSAQASFGMQFWDDDKDPFKKHPDPNEQSNNGSEQLQRRKRRKKKEKRTNYRDSVTNGPNGPEFDDVSFVDFDFGEAESSSSTKKDDGDFSWGNVHVIEQDEEQDFEFSGWLEQPGGQTQDSEFSGWLEQPGGQTQDFGFQNWDNQEPGGLSNSINVEQDIEDAQMAQINRQQVIELCQQGDYNNLLMLLENNNIDLNFVDQNTGLTPLLIACVNIHSAIVTYLLTKGADIALADRTGRTFLHYAAQVGSIDFIKCALAQGMDINCVDMHHGNSPLHIACLHSNFEVVRFLIRQGANTLQQNKDNNLPAVFAEDDTIRNFLLSKSSQVAMEALNKMQDLQERVGRQEHIDYKDLYGFEVWLVRNGEYIEPYVLQSILLDLSTIYQEDLLKAVKQRQYQYVCAIIKSMLRYIPFNYRVFHDVRFAFILRLAIQAKILDINGESVLSAGDIFCKSQEVRCFLLQQARVLFEQQLRMQNTNNSVVYAVRNYITYWLQYRNQPEHACDRYFIDFLNLLYKEDKVAFNRFVNFARLFSDIRRGIMRLYNNAARDRGTRCTWQRNMRGSWCHITDVAAHIMRFLPGASDGK